VKKSPKTNQRLSILCSMKICLTVTEKEMFYILETCQGLKSMRNQSQVVKIDGQIPAGLW